MRRVLLLIALACLCACIRPVVAWAHPLGNFTINRYGRLEVQPGLIRLRYVLDEAEIPTYQDMAMLHPGGAPTATEKQRFLAVRVEQLRAHLQVTVGGQPVAVTLEPGTATLTFPPGQGGLPLLRIMAWFRADLPPAAAGSTDVGFVDDNYDDRLGWKEIVVRGMDGVAIQQSSVTAVDQSDELRSYPQDMLASPLDVRSAQFSFTAATGEMPAGANLLQPRGRSSSILTAATDAFTALVSRQALTLPFILFALLAAIALGGVHALSPGHGKTIVGAYLVGSRGTARHAALLGLTVTITHTAGVFALGFITLFAAHFIMPERLYPWLSTISGLLVASIGGWLLFVRLRAVMQGRRATSPARAAVRHETHTHDPEHTHGHTHVHADQHGSLRVDDDHLSDGTVMTHEHGGVSHQHVLPGAGAITPRGLIALGVSGGLLPCPSALVVLLAAMSLQRVAFGIVLVIAFSIGLAGVLTGIGLLLVYARGFFARFRLEAGAGRFLPAASAAVVLALGLIISLRAVAQSGLFA